MAEKLAAYAARAGLADVGLVTDAYFLAMRPRISHFADVFHPDLLHPARTALILLEHTDCRDSEVLAAGVLTETLYPTARAELTDIAALGQNVLVLVQAVPQPSQEDGLLERMLVSDRAAALIALAERLDHARHLHLRDQALWRAYFEQTVEVYLPLALRLDFELHRRFERWVRAFQRRLA